MRVLLVIPEFYDYHHRIVAEIRNQGHEVLWFPERPTRLVYSGAKRLSGAIKRWVYKGYQKKILRESGWFQADIVVVIRGEIIEPWFMKTLRERLPRSHFMMYQWDAVRVVDYRPLLGFFHRVATFDSADAQQLRVLYRPLFYTPEYRIEADSAACTYDLVFVASYHLDRYQTLKAIESVCQLVGMRFKYVLYIARLDYWKLLILGKQRPRSCDVTFHKLSREDVIDIYRRARAVLDIENSKQSGLTMRTFEVLATGRILVTTNPLAGDLLPEFSSQIVVIPREFKSIPAHRIQEGPLAPPSSIQSHSLSAWVSDLLAMR